MAKRDMGGMGTFDARNHLDKNDPGMPQFLRALNAGKKKDKRKDAGKNFLKSMIPDQAAADLIFMERDNKNTQDHVK